jgi:hypothetical protein
VWEIYEMVRVVPLASIRSLQKRKEGDLHDDRCLDEGYVVANARDRIVMSEETDELVRAVTELIGNIRCAKNVAAIARRGGPRAKETEKLIAGMSRALRRHRKTLEATLKREDCTDEQRRAVTEHIQLIILAEHEVDGTAPAAQS